MAIRSIVSILLLTLVGCSNLPSSEIKNSQVEFYQPLYTDPRPYGTGRFLPLFAGLAVMDKRPSPGDKKLLWHNALRVGTFDEVITFCQGLFFEGGLVGSNWRPATVDEILFMTNDLQSPENLPPNHPIKGAPVNAGWGMATSENAKQGFVVHLFKGEKQRPVAQPASRSKTELSIMCVKEVPMSVDEEWIRNNTKWMRE